MKEKYDNEYWFPAKRYGWGWGPPRTWQGWLVLAGYFAVIILAMYLRTPDNHPTTFYIVMITSTALFIAICYAKGEPPRWRWGSDDLK